MYKINFHFIFSFRFRFFVRNFSCGIVKAPEDFPPELQNMAASLSMVAGKSVSPAALAAAMIDELTFMAKNLTLNRDALMDRYRRDCVTIGQEVRIMTDPPRQGFAEDVDQNGSLLVRFADGHFERVNAGEVSVRGMYGYV